MATSFDEIYRLFIFKVKAYELQMLLPDEREEILQIYLNSAVTKFYKKSRTDILDQDGDLLQFNNELQPDEKNILAENMVTEWLKPQLLSDELLESRLNTKDFTEYSPAKLIEQIRTVFELSKKETRQLIIDYTYSHGDIANLTR